jgi:hypothetical protein
MKNEQWKMAKGAFLTNLLDTFITQCFNIPYELKRGELRRLAAT